MKQPKTIIKYLVNDPRFEICFEMTVSLSRPPVYAEQISEATGISAAGTGQEPKRAVPGPGVMPLPGREPGGAGRRRGKGAAGGCGCPTKGKRRNRGVFFSPKG